MDSPPHVEVAAYILGVLNKEDSEAFDRHLLDCPSCQDELRDMYDLPDALDVIKRGMKGTVDGAARGTVDGAEPLPMFGTGTTPMFGAGASPMFGAETSPMFRADAPPRAVNGSTGARLPSRGPRPLTTSWPRRGPGAAGRCCSAWPPPRSSASAAPRRPSCCGRAAVRRTSRPARPPARPAPSSRRAPAPTPG